MLTFEPITPENAAKLRPYYENCHYRLCEYSAGVKVMWRKYLYAEFTEAAGCLIVRSCTHGHYEFDFPVPGPEGDVDEALRLIEEWCTKNGWRLIPHPVFHLSSYADRQECVNRVSQNVRPPKKTSAYRNVCQEL